MSSLVAHGPTLALTDDVASFLSERLHSAVGGQQNLWLTVPAPRRSPERLLELAAELADAEHAFLWHPPTGAAASGIGLCHRLPLEGSARFAELRRGAEEVFAHTRSETHPRALPFAPRMFGGLAFDVGSASEAPWSEFGDGCFTLPRFLYAVDGELASLTLVLRADELRDAGSITTHIDETEKVLEGLATGSIGGSDRVVAEPIAEPVDDPHWIEQVSAIRDAIVRGEVQKIVAARRSVVPLVGTEPKTLPAVAATAAADGMTSDADAGHALGAGASAALLAARVLRQLAGDRVSSTRFAFCRQDAVFLGVTPEKLLSKQGRRVVTEALAGSIESGGEHAAELLDSGKDRLEQQLVVDAIVRRLEPLCDRLQVAARPTVRELRDVFHLHTPIQGTLERQRHVLELAELLHPTPAVGGVPTPRAVEWIRQRETHERGWYAAPIGWFDAEGDGELLVALRSCVLSEGKAYLYAGAGIVADSDPERELRETELKQRALLEALRN